MQSKHEKIWIIAVEAGGAGVKIGVLQGVGGVYIVEQHFTPIFITTFFCDISLLIGI